MVDSDDLLKGAIGELYFKGEKPSLISPKGRIDSSAAPKLEENISELFEKGEFKLALDLSEVDYLSSAGLRVIIHTQKECRRYQRGNLVIVNPHPNAYEAIDQAGFLPLFNVYKQADQKEGQIEERGNEVGTGRARFDR